MKTQKYIDLLTRLYDAGDSRFFSTLRDCYFYLSPFELEQIAALCNAPVITIEGGIEEKGDIVK